MLSKFESSGRLALVLGLLAGAAAGCGGGGANSQKLCEEACDRALSCARGGDGPAPEGLAECKQRCLGDSAAECSNDSARISAAQACLTMTCDELLACATSIPACEVAGSGGTAGGTGGSSAGGGEVGVGGASGVGGAVSGIGGAIGAAGASGAGGASGVAGASGVGSASGVGGAPGAGGAAGAGAPTGDCAICTRSDQCCVAANRGPCDMAAACEAAVVTERAIIQTACRDFLFATCL